MRSLPHNKRILAVALLVIFIGGLIIPTAGALAQEEEEGAVTKGLKATAVVAGAALAPLNLPLGASLATWGLGGGRFVKDILYGTTMLQFFAYTTNRVAQIAPFENWFVTSAGIGRAIRNGNTFILNLANLFYILLLLVISLATIFDLEQYKAQRLLPKLILAIILSNFGLFGVVVIANISQLLAQGLLGDSNTLVDGLIEATGVADLLQARAGELVLGVMTFIKTDIGLPLLFLYETLYPLNWFMVAFALTTIILIVRIVGLWIFAMFAPVGVALGILPSTKNMALAYWRKVISYSFVGPVMIFFIRMAVVVYTSFDEAKNPLTAGLSGQKAAWLPYGPAKFLQALSAAVILYMGIVFTRKMGVEVANWVLDKAQKAFKTAWTFVSGIGVAAAARGAAAAGGLMAKSAAAAGAGPGTGAGAVLSNLFNVGSQGFKAVAGSRKGGFAFRAMTALDEAKQQLSATPKEEKAGFVNEDRALQTNRDTVKKSQSKEYTDAAAAVDPKNEQEVLDTINKPGVDRGAMALALANAGKLSTGTFAKVAGLSTPTSDLVSKEMANYDVRALYDPANVADFEKNAGAYFAKNGIDNQSQDALANPAVWRAAVGSMSEAQLAKFFKFANRDQRDGFAKGGETAAVEHAAKNGDVTQLRKYIETTAKAGGDPVQLIKNVNAAAPQNAAVQAMTKEVERNVYNDPTFYVNVSPRTAVNMMSRAQKTPDIGQDLQKALGILNSSALKGRQDIKAAILAEARKGAGGALNADIADGLRAHIKTAMAEAVNKLGDMIDQVQRSQTTMGEELKEIKAKAEKAAEK